MKVTNVEKTVERLAQAFINNEQDLYFMEIDYKQQIWNALTGRNIKAYKSKELKLRNVANMCDNEKRDYINNHKYELVRVEF